MHNLSNNVTFLSLYVVKIAVQRNKWSEYYEDLEYRIAWYVFNLICHFTFKNVNNIKYLDIHEYPDSVCL